MALYAIGDLHLSLGSDKPMDKFGGWDNYVEKLETNWRKLVKPEDTIVLVGDTSWGMSLEESKEDFKFINNLPGEKIIIKGNHDYWWATKNKMDNFFRQNGFNTLKILNNNYYGYESYGICGTRGWINETSEPSDAKVLAREAMRLETSINMCEKDNKEPIVFLHYPPIYAQSVNADILDVLLRHKIRTCYYGHIHGKAFAYAFNGINDDIEYRLISSDYVQFCPQKII